MAYDYVTSTLDDRRDWSQGARNGLIAIREQSVVTADRIVGWRSVDSPLNITSIEVVVGSPAETVLLLIPRRAWNELMQDIWQAYLGKPS